VAKNNYNLLLLKDSEYQPIMLDLDEEVTCIKQHQKTGRIFYSSHCDSFTNVCIKELNPLKDGVIGSLMEKIGSMAISTFGINMSLSNKRLKSLPADDQSENIATKMIKSVAPSIQYFFSQRKMVTDIKFDE
jgi:hypothetical protein